MEAEVHVQIESKDFKKLQKELLKELQEKRPLQSYWLKKDYVEELEAVFIYYGVEPSLVSEFPEMPPAQILLSFDVENLLDILRYSELGHIYVPGRGVRLKEFIELLAQKAFDIPKHLQYGPKWKKVGVNDKQEGVDLQVNLKHEILHFDLNKFRKEQLQKLCARAFSTLYWKDVVNSKVSASELVETKQAFKDLSKLIDAEDIDIETRKEWVSDLGPRSRTNPRSKKNSK